MVSIIDELRQVNTRPSDRIVAHLISIINGKGAFQQAWETAMGQALANELVYLPEGGTPTADLYERTYRPLIEFWNSNGDILNSLWKFYDELGSVGLPSQVVTLLDAIHELHDGYTIPTGGTVERVTAFVSDSLRPISIGSISPPLRCKELQWFLIADWQQMIDDAKIASIPETFEFRLRGGSISNVVDEITWPAASAVELTIDGGSTWIELNNINQSTYVQVLAYADTSAFVTGLLAVMSMDSAELLMIGSMRIVDLFAADVYSRVNFMREHVNPVLSSPSEFKYISDELYTLCEGMYEELKD